MRTSLQTRETKETKITLKLNLDGTGQCKISTGIGFFDHMLTAFAVHSATDLELEVHGDLEVDGHHTVEDTGIVLGDAIKEALASGKAVARYGTAFIPMDESLGMCSLDLSNRAYLVYRCSYENSMVGGFDCCLAEEFFRAVAHHAGMTLHLNLVYGKNDHHKLEALFKAFAHAFLEAKREGSGQVLSTKGVL